MKTLTPTQILQVIGQLEASINKIEYYLNLEEFKEYCDTTHTQIAMWRVILKEVKEEADSGNKVSQH